MAITVIQGIVGSGKSTLLTHHGYKAYLRKDPVYANYWLSFPHKRLDLKKLSEDLPRLRDVTLLLDEGQNSVSSRTFMSSGNILFSRFVKQTRKMGVDLYIATQQVISIDIDIRRNLHTLQTCFPYRMVQDGNGRRVLRKATLFEIEHRQIDRIMIKSELFWAQENDKEAPVKWSILNPKRYFSLFNTRETFEII